MCVMKDNITTARETTQGVFVLSLSVPIREKKKKRGKKQ